MATMFPSDVDAFTTVGEGKTYQFFQKVARPDSAFLAWYSPDVEDKEPDFILFSPECGLIVFEVKDWALDQIIKADPKAVTLQLGATQERRKNPFAQAKEYVNSLLNLLDRGESHSSNGKLNLPCPVNSGAVLPHICRKDFLNAGLGEVMDASRILFWDDMQLDSPFVRDAAGQIFRQWLMEHFPPRFIFALSPAELDKLRAAIFPVVRIQLPQRCGTASELQQQNIIRVLNAEQDNLARSFNADKQLVTGPPGSGKTLILAHRAGFLPRVNKHVRRILIVCFNLSLVGYIRRLLSVRGVGLGSEGVEVLPFYSLCEKILGERLAHSQEQGDYYELVVRETLERLNGSHPLQGHWDAIMVDEGQDFSSDMAQVVLRLLPKWGSLLVTQDDNQCLYPQGKQGWDSLEIPGLRIHRLTQQYRNTKAIARIAARMLESTLSPESLVGAEGTRPELLECPDAASLPATVASAVAQLIRSGVPMNEIAVLYAQSKISGVENLPEALVQAIEAQGVLAQWAARDYSSKKNFDITTESVTISTIYSAKGLDFAHVFLLGLGGLNPASVHHRRLAYVGMTRARERLTICQCGKCAMTDRLFD
ncbi:NERD domain-containing protein/DEAD/DEAH box helicase [Desulfovibrio sp. UIB00]|nr:NERD domain-containing protein/DEAD/DEAH box helicase [Desulfovibrio sp. UIB00]